MLPAGNPISGSRRFDSMTKQPDGLAIHSDNLKGGTTMKRFALALSTFALIWASLASAATLNVNDYGGSIQAAIDAAAVGDTVYMPDGTYIPTSQININQGVILQGQSEAGVIIDETAVTGYGFSIAASDVTLENFTIWPPDQNYPIHASGTSNPPNGFDNLTIQNLTITGVHRRTGVDVHGYNNVVLSHITSNDAYGGNGFQVTGCINVDADNLSSASNAWGSFAIYCSNSSYLNRASDDVVIDGDSCSFGEYNVFRQDEFGLVNTNISVTGYEFIVRNMTFRPEAPGYYFFQDTFANALAMALSLSTPEDSYIITIAGGSLRVGAGMSIQAAIDGADDGGVINVDNGTYTEALAIAGKGVSIVGESEAGVIVEAAATQTGAANTFTINAAGYDIALEFITIRHGDYGIRSTDGNVSVRHCTLYHNGWDGTAYSMPYGQASAAADWAAYATNGGAMRIENSAASEIGWCTVYENDRGIRFQDGANGDIHDNTVTGNIEAGIYLAASSYNGATGCTDSDVYDNVSSGNYEHGLLCIGGLNNSFTGNTCEDNWNTGMMIWHPGEVSVEDNSFDGNNAYNFNGVGNGADSGGTIAVDGDTPDATATFSLVLSGNDISNGGVGSQAQAAGVHFSSPLPALPITVEGNLCAGMDIDVHVLAQAAMTTISGNSLSAATAIDNGDAALLNASGNYYGSTDAATVAGMIVGNVDYTPWLGGGTATSPGFDGDFAILYVDDDSPQAGVSGRVQEGVDLVTASTVNIAAGTYPGGVTIPTTMPMTLVGAGMAQTFLTGGMHLVDGVTGLTLQQLALSGELVAGAVIRAGHPNHDFTMDHVLIDGEGATYPARHGYAGGRTTGDVTIMNCEFKDIGGWSVFDSATSGWEAVMGTVTFANNSIHECDGAVAFRGAAADHIDVANVYGNVWLNINDNWNPPGTVENAWACFESNRIDLLNFYGNTMTNVAESRWSEGQGLQVWDMTSMDVHDNVFANCWEGIWAPGLVGGTNYPAPTGSAYDNDFSGCTDFAVSTMNGGSYSSGDFDARGNWWGHASGPYHATLNSGGLGSTTIGDVLIEPWTGMGVLSMDPASSGPINCSQTSTLSFDYTPDAFTPALRGYTIRVTATSEVSFTESDITVHTLVSGDTQYSDITMMGANDYLIDCAILGLTAGVTGPDSFFDITFHGDNAGAHSAATVSFVSCELRDLANLPIGGDCTATATIDVDCLAPTVPTMSAEPAYTQGLSNTVDWSDESGSGAVLYYAEAATDAGFTALVGNSGWIAGLNHLFGGLTDGQIYYYRVKAKDALDNETAFSAGVFSTQDDSPPATSADPLATYQTAATFDVAWTGADTDPGSGSFSGLDDVELFYSYESGAWTSYGSFTASPISFTAVDGDGDYEFYTLGTDNVGNVEVATGADTTTQLDTTNPVGTFVINADAVYTTTTGVTLNNAITDAMSGINQMRFRDAGGVWTAWEAYAASKGWTLPGPDGVNTVEAEFSDLAGNVYAISDGIILDTAAPGAVSDVDATPAHEEVLVTWTDPGDGDLASIEIWRAVWHLTGGGNEQVSAYPEYDDDNPAEPTRPTDYADAVASAEWILVGTVAPGTGSFTDAVVDRGVYYYEPFAIDMASNSSAIAAANDRATNYHLGDVQLAYSGTVDAGDITVLGAAYGTGDGDGSYNNECDVGPTDTASGTGIPTTDDAIGFEDLMIFALNYGIVAPLPAAQGSDTAHLSWFALEDGSWGLGLTEPCANLKALQLQARIPAEVEVTLTGGGLLNQQAGPIFLRQISGKGLDVSLAVMGEGVVFSGQGLLFSVTLPDGMLPTDLELKVRDAANAELPFEISATEVADLPTAYRLAGNFPNPFNPKTSISFDLPESQFVKLVVFAADGRRVTTLLNEQVAAGRHVAVWEGHDDDGRSVASGVYFARIQAGPLAETRKMLLMK
jgi:parallel beta-helix repeat protein